jgi:hypothetical protein
MELPLMKAAARAVRFRVFIFLGIYLLGFLAPWERYLGGNNGALWLAASTFLARSGWISLAAATLTVTFVALACLAAGTVLRVWATAYLGSGYLRNLGAWMFAVGVSILMPLSGALFFLLAFTIFIVFLGYAQERFLSPKRGEVYTRPRWLDAVLAEIHPIAFTLCFAIFAWRYNARILIQCLLVSYGLSLVIRAFSMRTVSLADESSRDSHVQTL